MVTECPSCGEQYKKIGSHYTLSDCGHPEFTDRQVEILEGMMLGDGWVNHHNETGNPFFAVGMTNYKFLKWLDTELKPHSTGVKNATGSKNSTKDYYKVRTRRNPNLSGFASWYDSGTLRLKHVDLTPLSLKMWYVSDGWLSYRGRNGKPILRIGNRIAIDRDNYFTKLFDPFDVSPSVYEGEIAFDVDETEKLLNLMGKMPPGFEYKSDHENNDDNQVKLL